jgi:large subunit ribosomal protein L23
MNVHDIILKPIISEKSMAGATAGKFTFAVSKRASKKAIKDAVQKAFNVHVTAIGTTVVKGKTKLVGLRRKVKKQPEWKKTIIELKKGEKIGLFEPGGES